MYFRRPYSNNFSNVAPQNNSQFQNFQKSILKPKTKKYTQISFEKKEKMFPNGYVSQIQILTSTHPLYLKKKKKKNYK